ncbi:hypothetical protein ANANG_G00008410 [Anguilla anguilla]|uniref:Uncharacterized protein n=1 Tax=Anguilla anguilla TaxID=7936 RepID=A0A9D3SB02_ANGAN|nr:hypothetical protein ANANG_G00008410 [Anguilla anguilla]
MRHRAPFTHADEGGTSQQASHRGSSFTEHSGSQPDGPPLTLPRAPRLGSGSGSHSATPRLKRAGGGENPGSQQTRRPSPDAATEGRVGKRASSSTATAERYYS